MLIQEIKRFQYLAGIIEENQSLNELNDAEQEVTTAILSEYINEVKFNPKEILTKLLYAAKKGVLTTAILSSVLASCNFDSKTNETIKSTIEKSPYEIVDSSQLSKIKDENTSSYEDTLNKIETIKAISPKEDTLQTKVIEYIMKYFLIDEINYKFLPNYSIDHPGYDAGDEVRESLIETKIEVEKLKKEIIASTSVEYFNNIDKISKKIVRKYRDNLFYLSDSEAVIEKAIESSSFLKLNIDKASFIKKWNELFPDVLAGWNIY